MDLTPPRFQGPLTIVCNICINSIDNKAVFLPCKHWFHKKCLKKWHDKLNIESCPLCRKSLDETAEIKILIDHVLVKLGCVYRNLNIDVSFVEYFKKLFEEFPNLYGRNTIEELCIIEPILVGKLSNDRMKNLIERKYFFLKENNYIYIN